MLKFAPLDLLKFSEFDHFRSKSPLPFPVKPLLVKPLPVGYFHVPLTWFSIHFCTRSIHFCGSTHVCAVRFFFRPFRLMLVQLDLFVCVSLYLYAVRFIFVRFDWFVSGSIYVCAGSIQFLCSSKFIFWAVRFIFGWFDSFFAVLIFRDRFSFYLCAFHIVHFVAWRFCPYRSAIVYFIKLWKILFTSFYKV